MKCVEFMLKKKKKQLKQEPLQSALRWDAHIKWAFNMLAVTEVLGVAIQSTLNSVSTKEAKLTGLWCLWWFDKASGWSCLNVVYPSSLVTVE